MEGLISPAGEIPRDASEEALPWRAAMTVGLFCPASLLLLTVFAFLAAIEMDAMAVQEQRALVRHGLSSMVAGFSNKLEMLRTRIGSGPGPGPAGQEEMIENFDRWVYRSFGHDRGYLVDSKNQLIFASRQGRAITPPHDQNDQGAIIELARHVWRQVDTLDFRNKEFLRLLPVSTILHSVEGMPVLLSAFPILPKSSNSSAPEDQVSVYIALRYLDRQEIERIAHRDLVLDLSYSPVWDPRPLRANVPVVLANRQRIGYLSWAVDYSSLRFFKQLAIAAGIVLLASIGASLLIAIKLRHAAAHLRAIHSRHRHLAHSDVLTGLSSSGMFYELLSPHHGRPEGCDVAVLIVNIDRFSQVIHCLGYSAGDMLLQQAAERIRNVVEESGTVVRMGGDEFAIVILSSKAIQQATHVAERLLTTFMPPFYLKEDLVNVSASVGIAISAFDNTSHTKIIRNARIALRQARQRGRCRYHIFSGPDEILVQRYSIENDLRKALREGDALEPAYQPLYSPQGKLTGAEVLLRWKKPTHQPLSPSSLTGIAEECGLIAEVGDWVLGEACRMAAEVPVPWIAVNVSPLQLCNPGFAGRWLRIIRSYGIEPPRIRLELTETAPLSNIELAREGLRILRAAGVYVAIDDFGTGYSSMSCLHHLPWDGLKIDRRFVHKMLMDEQGRAIIASMITMARALGLGITAEGVETVAQRDMLQRLGCGQMQGYLFSRPLSAKAFAERVRQHISLEECEQ